MKKILFVINTLGQAGAETALLELLRQIDPKQYEVSLFVLMGQGEMISRVPDTVKICNRTFRDCSVLSAEGRKGLVRTILKAMLRRGTVLRLFPYLVKNFLAMRKRGKILPDKLLWRVLSDGADRLQEEYDLAVAYLEGGSTYYVADWVRAKRKAAFVHVDYAQAGYTKELDLDCYRKYTKVFAVSDEVKTAFLKVYGEYAGKTEVFHNILNPESIRSKAQTGQGFAEPFEGIRIVSVGRLTAQKAFEVSIDAMKLVKDAGRKVRWYVFGEGDQRKMLEERIAKLGLKEDFLLPGAVSNPYPYMKQADIYVHASRFEGKSIAIQEAQILGKPILVSDCSGNREQVIQDVDGLLCEFCAEGICEGILQLLDDADRRERLGRAAAEKNKAENTEIVKLLSLTEG